MLKHRVTHYLLFQVGPLPTLDHHSDCFRPFEALWQLIDVKPFKILDELVKVGLNVLFSPLLQLDDAALVVHVLQLVLFLSLEDQELMGHFVQLFLLDVLKLELVLDEF